MKIGPREYNEQEIAIINVYKNHIAYLQKEIDFHWNQLVSQLKVSENLPFDPEHDFLWDYVMNDFSVDHNE